MPFVIYDFTIFSTSRLTLIIFIPTDGIDVTYRRQRESPRERLIGSSGTLARLLQDISRYASYREATAES